MKLCLITLGLVGLTTLAQAFLINDNPRAISRLGGFSQGPNCGTRRCLPNEARCVDGQCQCKNGKVGDGALACNFPETSTCCISNDPSVNNFQNEFFEYPLPCSSNFAHYESFHPFQDTWHTTSMGWKCSVQIQTYNERIKGKIFNAGFDVALTFNKGQDEVSMKFRGFGESDVEDSKWKFNTLVKVGNGRWTSSQDDDAPTSPLLNYYFGTVNTHKYIVLNVRKCGLHVVFRPANPEQGRDQVRVPGTCLSVNPKDCGEVVWQAGSLCSGPNGNTLEDLRATYGVDTTSEAAIQAALLSGGQNANFIPGTCSSLAQTVRQCQNSPARNQLASSTCLYILENEHTVNCVSRPQIGSSDLTNAEDITQLYYDCYNSICNADVADCKAVRAVVQDRCSSNIANAFPITDAFCDALV